ncbi:hypothetical protein P691DRAFT_735535 [Macrolepiota fuliginosa MF-IS2]|uniref:Cyclochlorotine biosynthesis protein O n=1 Tax=Macrolepiota fuliginosa MF-IS2 TaxID=1400762 RepID=A0A9P5X7Z1_9AGAR|nr:hypothetical protein P691DRAFT_735962 [Macrolepiota fuliginosa MF-IS2]KAF9445092.1 hypothetical protein P691DRAFT_735535 [Macrolepiota fuliginosa MF-IS2]
MHDKGTDLENNPLQPARRNIGHRIFLGFFIVSVLLNGFLLYTRGGSKPMISTPFPQLTYSPAEDHIEYKLQKFTRGHAGDVPVYEQLPSPEVDKAWGELHMWAGSKVPASIVRKMSNATWSIPELEGWFVTSLDVFHQLHCLDTIRQVLHPDDYPDMQRLSKVHLRHCIGAIRQSLMCFSDVTPIVWQWNETIGMGDQRDDIVHTCRNFERIQEWGKENFYSDMLDLETHVEWDINV